LSAKLRVVAARKRLRCSWTVLAGPVNRPLLAAPEGLRYPSR
jgi:hypothetical protein